MKKTSREGRSPEKGWKSNKRQGMVTHVDEDQSCQKKSMATANRVLEARNRPPIKHSLQLHARVAEQGRA